MLLWYTKRDICVVGDGALQIKRCVSMCVSYNVIVLPVVSEV